MTAWTDFDWQPLVTYEQRVINWLTKGGQSEGTVGYGTQTHTWHAANIEYGLPSHEPFFHVVAPEFDQMTPMTAHQADMMREAFELWDDLIAIDLDPSTSWNAEITVAYTTALSGVALGSERKALDFGASTATNVRIDHADVWMRADSLLTSDKYLSYGGAAFKTSIHEIGHALGLTHPGNYNAEDDHETSHQYRPGYKEATQQYTVMSYLRARTDGSAAELHVGRPTDAVVDDARVYASTPLLHDILAIQALYGADMTTRTGDTTYGFHSNAGRDVFDFTKNPYPVIAIWDAGGIDTIDASGFSSEQTIDLRQAHFSNIGTLEKNVAIAYGAEIENAIGGSGRNTLIGNEKSNTLVGGSDKDVIDGQGGSDTMIGGNGDDIYVVDRGRSLIAVGDFIVKIDPGDQIVELDGPSSGTDTVRSWISYTLGDNLENLELLGTDNIDGVGNAKSNMLRGNGGSNTLIGRGGNDYYFVGAGDRIVERAGEGYDAAYANCDDFVLPENVEELRLLGSAVSGRGNAGNNALYGNDDAGSDDWLQGLAGNDTLYGGAGMDTLDGGGDNDVLEGGAGGDALFGGEGKDTASYAGSRSAVSVSLAGAVLGGDADGDALYSIESLIGSQHADRLTGDAGSNVIEGGFGADILAGGGGLDTLSYAGSKAGVTVNLATRTASGGDAHGDTFSGFVNLTGSDQVDNLTGDGNANVIDGGKGADTMAGGKSDDTYHVDSEADTISESAGEGTDTVFATVNYTLRSNVEKLFLVEGAAAAINAAGNGATNFLYGNALANALSGNGGGDVLVGGAGNDILDGGTGNDTMAGGKDNDTYHVDSEADTIIENAGEGTDTVFASVNYTLRDNFELLFLKEGAAGAINGAGNGGDNRIYGNSLGNALSGKGGKDTLVGGIGNDTLDGGADVDLLHGGADNDTFVFKAGQANGDTVLDFAGNGAGVGDTFKLVGFGTTAQGATFTHVGTGNTWQIHSGLDGHNETITLGNGASVHASDFLFI